MGYAVGGGMAAARLHSADGLPGWGMRLAAAVGAAKFHSAGGLLGWVMRLAVVLGRLTPFNGKSAGVGRGGGWGWLGGVEG